MNVVGLRARPSSLKQDLMGNEDDEDSRPWRRRLLSAMKLNVSLSGVTWSSVVRVVVVFVLVVMFGYACYSLPVEKVLLFINLFI